MLKSKLPTKMVIQPPRSQRGSLSLKKYFLKDPNADLFINVASKIFPVHRSQLQSIPYFQHIAKNEKIHLIHEPINVQMPLIKDRNFRKNSGLLLRRKYRNWIPTVTGIISDNFLISRDHNPTWSHPKKATHKAFQLRNRNIHFIANSL